LLNSHYEKFDDHLRKSITQAFQFLLISQRNSRNLSQYELSKRCGFSRQYISLVESGKKTPSLSFTLSFAEGFDMRAEDFILMLIEKVLYYESLP